MVEPISDIALVVETYQKVRKVDAFLEGMLGNTQRFLQAKQELDEQWFVEVVNLLNEQGERWAEVDEQKRLEERAGEDAIVGIFWNYVRSAREEVLIERRRMLAYATASIANLSLTAGELARVQRVMRELDPSDVVALYKVSLIPPGEVFNDADLDPANAATDTGEGLAYRYWQEEGAEALESSGCIAIRSHDPGTIGGRTVDVLRVTATGETVLKAMHPYIIARYAPEDPSRETQV